MAFPPALARALARMGLPEAERERLAALHYHDAGHGYDLFGMHPDFVAFGEALVSPLYQRYFRVRSCGAHHIPSVGPAVLAANHSGNLPIDGMMIWADVLRQTDPPRVARPIADHFVPSLPWVGTLFARTGMVGGSRGNARALLESGNLLLIFPEGVPGITKGWSKRYQLQHFRVGHAELAIRHRAPIVPVAVIGAEEQYPELFSSKRLGALFGIERVNVPATPIPLPVRYHIHYGPPIRVDEELRPSDADDPAVVAGVAARVQEAVAALITAGLAARKWVFL
jgi:1-acyl-sn-glycerol-3-phosphate acyltransferase